MQKYLIIGVVVLFLLGALGTAGKIIYEQGKAISTLKTAVESEKAAREEIRKNIKEQNQKVEEYNKNVASISDDRKKTREKGIEHASRVKRIAVEKPKLYEKLVNKDFSKTQEELRGLML